jgi:hypothetical protein
MNWHLGWDGINGARIVYWPRDWENGEGSTESLSETYLPLQWQSLTIMRP